MAWPTDDLIEDQLKKCHGVLGVVAERLGCNYEQLTMHVGKSAHLAYVLQRSSTSAVDDATFFLRHGCKAGDMASIALYLKKIKDDREAGGGGNGLAGQPIDFTREVETVHDLTDAEVIQIREVIDRDYLVEGDLRREVSMSIKRLMDMGCYRGQRHRRGLPVRGQRTRTNARTRKGPRKAIRKT